MAKVTKKTSIGTLDGTPKKRLFLSIISDYDLKTSLCELVDNAIDQWTDTAKKPGFCVKVTLDPDRQIIRVEDNAGGVRREEIEFLVAPGGSKPRVSSETIGVFGVGGKRAGIALGETVEIKTRFRSGPTYQIDLTAEWLEVDDWEIEVYQIPDISASTTIVEISKMRQSFSKEIEEEIRQHFASAYGQFIAEGCRITVNKVEVNAADYKKWSYPPMFVPTETEFEVEPVEGRKVRVKLTGGLISDRVPEAENYGVYFYCNRRLIVKELRSRDVGYFISSEAGVPHPDASLCRVVVEYNGEPDLMPWNSSKNGLNYSHPSFIQVRNRVIDFVKFYTGASRRTKGDWTGNVYQYSTGTPKTVPAGESISTKKTVLPKLPRSRSAPRLELLRDKNRTILSDKPWTVGLVEAIGVVDLLSRQKLATRNRISLILLDSNLEIGLKEFIVNRSDLFPPYKYTNSHIVNLFQNRTSVLKEVLAHINISAADLGKINHYYSMRNSLIHQRATVQVTDTQIEDYQKVVERVLSKLFALKFNV